MRHSRRFVLVGVLALTFVLSGVVRADILKQVPSNAILVVKITKLNAFNTKLSNFFKQLGLVEMQPDLADPITAVQKQAGMTQGVNKAGDMAFALLNPPAKQSFEKSMLLLIPVTDYKAFLANFPGAKTQGTVSQINLPHDPDPSFVSQWGDYAAISPTKSILAKKPEGISVQGLAAKELESKDVVFYGNMAVLRDRFLPELKANRPKWIAEMELQLGQLDPAKKKYAPVIRLIADQGLNYLETLLRDTQSALFSIHMAPEGIKTCLMAEFEPASYIGKTVAQIKNSDGSMLAGLPDGKYVIFGGEMQDPVLAGKIAGDVLDPALSGLKLLPEAKPIVDYLEAVKKQISVTEGHTSGWLAPSGPLGAESLLQIISIGRGNSQVMHETQKQMMASQEELKKMINPKGGNIETITITPQAKTMDGVTFDQFQIQINADPQNPAEMQAAQLVKFIYGPNGLSGLIGPIDKEKLLVTVGLNDVQMGKTIAAAKADQDKLGQTPAVKAVVANLPAKRVMAMYISLDTIISTALDYARNFGLPVQLQIPPDQPPVGVTLATQGSAVRADAYVPFQLIQSIVSAGLQSYQQMMQPVPPGQPGPGPGL